MNHPLPARATRRRSSARAATMSLAASAWLIALSLLSAIAAFFNRPPRREERGDVIVQHLGVILLAVVALVVMFAAIQLLGVDVITKVRNQLGL
jgi:uncharacterized BrkB/YihY/UPF0761 family membrane protein